MENATVIANGYDFGAVHAAMRRYVDHVLGQVLAVPGSRGDALLETVETLLVTTSLNDAASVLRLHRHTIVYRTRRLAELGIRLDAPAARQRLWLALQCRRLLGEGTQAGAAPAGVGPTR